MEIEELKIARTLKRDAYTLYFFLMLWMGTITKCYKTFFLSLYLYLSANSSIFELFEIT